MSQVHIPDKKDTKRPKAYHSNGMVLTTDWEGAVFIMNSYNGEWMNLDYGRVHDLRDILAAYFEDNSNA